MKRKTTEEFKNELNDKYGDEYSVKDIYINNATKIKIRHNKCGKTYMVRPNDILRGKRCPYCSKMYHKRMTNKEFIERVYNLVGNEYILLTEYEGTDEPVLFHHNKCNVDFAMTPNHFLNRGDRCPYCSMNKKHDTQWFKDEVEKKYPGEYLVEGEYINNKTPIAIRHLKCGTIFFPNPNNFLSKNTQCPSCYGNIKLTTDEFKCKVFEKVGDEYTVLGEYINSNTPISIRHNTCNTVYNVRPTDFLNKGNRCPKCSACKRESRAEIELYNYINKKISKLYPNLNINVIRNDRNVLNGKEIDIFIPELNLGIEYDGLYWHTIDKVGKDYHLNKTELCEKNGIELIHIFENEWLHNKKAIKNLLKYKLNTEKTICENISIKRTNDPYKNSFYKKYSLNDGEKFNFALGYKLLYNNKIIGFIVICNVNQDIFSIDEIILKGNYLISEECMLDIINKIKKNLHTNQLVYSMDRRYNFGNNIFYNTVSIKKVLPKKYFFSENSTYLYLTKRNDTNLTIENCGYLNYYL